VVWLLQSRPVTALAAQVPVEVVVPPGYWVRDPYTAGCRGRA
jgi:hypothetical protein